MGQAKIKIKDGVLLKYLSDEEEIVIPEGVTEIGSKVFCSLFKKCKNVKKVIIPDFITSINRNAFQECRLSDIVVDENNENYASVDGVLYNKSKNEILKCPFKNGVRKFIVPDGVTRIGYAAFRGSGISKITLPRSIEKLDDYSLCPIHDVYYEGNQGQWAMVEKGIGIISRGTVYFSDGGKDAYGYSESLLDMEL